VQETLEAAGARVTTAGSAAEALAALKQLRPDVLLADIGMPGEDGYGLIARIRGLSDAALRDIPAAALTAYARPEDRVRALQSGFEMHLGKPVDLGELVASVAALAKRARGSGP
jgi:CheY-like chemotaxis protein